MFIAKLIRGYLRGEKQSASLTSIHKEPPRKPQSKQVSSQEAALNNHSHGLFQVILQPSLFSEGNGVMAAPQNQPGLGGVLWIGSGSAGQSPPQDRAKGSVCGETKPGDF